MSPTRFAPDVAARLRLSASGRFQRPVALLSPQPVDSSWAQALDLDPAIVTATTLDAPAGAAAIRNDLGVIKPRSGGSFVLLSTGIAGAGTGGLAPPEPGTDFCATDSCPVPDGAAGDVATLELDINVPANTNRLSFQYNFLSAESPEFVGTIFNDTFTVTIVDSKGNKHDFPLASVNNSQFFDVSDSRAKDSGFDLYSQDPLNVDTVFDGTLPDAGLTDFQAFNTEVTPGDNIKVIFSIQDAGDGILDSTVILDALQFSSIDTVDPNPDLLVGGVLTADPAALATGGREVRGAVADGTAEVLLRVKATAAGSITFSLPAVPAGAPALANGTLRTTSGNELTDTLTVQTVPAAGADYAFAVYRAPPDFNIDDDTLTLIERPVSIAACVGETASCGAQDVLGAVNLQIKRPPVVLARGLWSDNHFWTPPDTSPHDPTFVPNDPRFAVTYAAQSYSCTNELRLQVPAGAVVSTCPWQRVAPPDGTVLCKSETETAIGAATAEALVNVRRLGIAASKVDLVTHGDMGVQARAYIASPNYQNDVNRLITVNTPHLGSSAIDAVILARGHAENPSSTPDCLSQTPTAECFLCQARLRALVPLDLGAIDDLKTQRLALPLTPVPANAIAGTGGAQLDGPTFKARSSPIFSIYSDIKTRMGVSVGKTSVGCNAFGANDHDLFVDVPSQFGGIDGVAQSPILMDTTKVKPTDPPPSADKLSDYIHSTRNIRVAQRIVTLLNSPISGPTSPFAEFPSKPSIPQACPVITTVSLPAGQVGAAYSASLTATGGAAPYVWSLTSGTLPAGLALDGATGAITGTPTEAVTATPLTFNTTDSSNPVKITTVPLTLTTTSALNPPARTPAIAGLPALAGVASTVRIVSPANGSDVIAGDTLAVTVEVDGFVPATVLVAVKDSVAITETAPFVVNVKIPREALGPTPLFAVGVDANDESVVSGAFVLNVRTNALLQTVKVITQDPVLFGAGRHRQLAVLGNYSDDVDRDITSSQVGTEYISSNLNVVTVSADGELTSVGTGIATMAVRNGTVQDTITVTVKANRAPTARAGADISRVCVTPGAAVPVQLDGSQSSDPEGDPLTFTWSEGGVVLASGPTPLVTLGPGEHQIDLIVSDGTSDSPADAVKVSILADTTPPVISCPANPTIECKAHTGVATFAATASDDCTLASQVCVPPSGSQLPLGVTLDTCTATDAAGNAASCTFSITVRDSKPPVISTRRDPIVLWPPDGKYRTFQLSDCVTSVVDACEGRLDISTVGKITRITSDEPERDRDRDDDHGHGHDRDDHHGRGHDHDRDDHHGDDDHDDHDDTCRDIVITGDTTAKLRAERDSGNGRVYTVFFTVTDASGNVGAGHCEVAVPHQRHEPAIEDRCRFCEGSGCGSCPAHSPACR